MTDTDPQRLLVALYAAVFGMHPLYPSATTWRGGPGAQVLTRGCSFTDPPPDHSEAEESIEGVLRDALRGLDPAEVAEIAASAARLVGGVEQEMSTGG